MRYLAGLWKERFIYRYLIILGLLCLGAAANGVERIYYHVNDPSGSPLMIVDAEGAVVARYTYTPLGLQVAGQSSVRQRPGFVGGIRETPGLHYLKYRYYNPQLGRFYQPDPMGFLGYGTSQINRYAYGLNDPYTHQDKDGRCLPVCLLTGAVALAPEEMATLTIGCARFCGPFLNFVEGVFNPGVPSPAGFAESRLAGSIKAANVEIGLTTRVADNAVLVSQNDLNHIFGNASHNLDDLIAASGGSQLNAFRAVQDAANVALKAGKLSAGPNGILPGGQAGAILKVNGVDVQLVGGRVVDGVVRIGSFSRRYIP